MITQKAKDRRFLIRPVRSECAKISYRELCHVVECFGGEEAEGGFAFPTATDRAMAVDLLNERFGARYFDVL